MSVCAVNVTVLAVRWETNQDLRIYSSSIIVIWIGSEKFLHFFEHEVLNTSVSTSRTQVEYLHYKSMLCVICRSE